MDARFQKIVDKLLIIEGGYVDDPRDRGGETKFGISKRRYPALDIKNLTKEQAVNIFYTDFWTMYGYDRIEDDRLAEKVFSFCVNMGPNQAHVILQIALNQTGCRVVVDGLLGPKTIAAVNGHPNPAWLLAAYRLEVIKYYLSLEAGRFERGWIRRAVE